MVQWTISLVMLASAAVMGVAAAQSQPASKVVVSNGAHSVILRLHRGPVTESFTLANDAKIRLASNSNASLTGLKVGDIAQVFYTIENGRWIAHEIVVNQPHGSHDEDRSNRTGISELHAHGRILAYNAATSNLTIKYQH